MQISSRFTIGTHVLVMIALKGDCTKVTSDMIAESVGVNPVIIRKTLSQLKKAGLIHVARGTGGELIINPGSIGQPFFLEKNLRKDLRAMYAILEFDQMGLKDVDFRRVDYDVQKELQLAKDLHLPYYQVYYESLVNGIHHTHNHELLHEIEQREGHDREIDAGLEDFFQ